MGRELLENAEKRRLQEGSIPMVNSRIMASRIWTVIRPRREDLGVLSCEDGVLLVLLRARASYLVDWSTATMAGFDLLGLRDAIFGEPFSWSTTSGVFCWSLQKTRDSIFLFSIPVLMLWVGILDDARYEIPLYE